MFFEHISAEVLLFFILYGATGVVPLIASLYLLLRRGNAFSHDVTPPVRLRRWAAAFFGVMAQDHVWWLLFYIYSDNIRSEGSLLYSLGYAAIAMFDCVGMLITIFGTMLAMLQDRRRPVWPTFAAALPFVVLLGSFMVWHDGQNNLFYLGYFLLLYVLFLVYMVFSIRQYGRWLHDNYADLERKEVWRTHVVVLFFTLLFLLYNFVEIDSMVIIYILHIFQLVFFVFLLWRVETLSSIAPNPSTIGEESIYPQVQVEEAEPATLLPNRRVGGGFVDIEQLLAEHCVATRLYLQHDLSLHQLARAIGTNRSYLSQYFSLHGITYNIYINDLRINYFIDRYQEAVANGLPVVAQQLASESGYRSYSTFSLAFKQRMGQSVTAWMRGKEG